MPAVRIRFAGGDEALDDLFTALDRELSNGLQRAAELVALQASTTHPYTDRTGGLSRSIQAAPVIGSIATHNLRGVVVAGEDYASFVEEGTSRSRPYPYLAPAAAAVDAAISTEGEKALEAAARRAGWA